MKPYLAAVVVSILSLGQTGCLGYYFSKENREFQAAARAEREERKAKQERADAEFEALISEQQAYYDEQERVREHEQRNQAQIANEKEAREKLDADYGYYLRRLKRGSASSAQSFEKWYAEYNSACFRSLHFVPGDKLLPVPSIELLETKLIEIKAADAQAEADFDPSTIDRTPVVDVDKFSGNGTVESRVWTDTSGYVEAGTRYINLRANLKDGRPFYSMGIEFRYVGTILQPIRSAVVVWNDPIAGDGRFTIRPEFGSNNSDTSISGSLSLGELTLLGNAQSVEIAFYTSGETAPIFGPFMLNASDKAAVEAFIMAVSKNSHTKP